MNGKVVRGGVPFGFFFFDSTAEQLSPQRLCVCTGGRHFSHVCVGGVGWRGAHVCRCGGCGAWVVGGVRVGGWAGVGELNLLSGGAGRGGWVGCM